MLREHNTRRKGKVEKMNPIQIADEISLRVGTRVCDLLLAVSARLDGACSDKTAVGYFAIAFVIIALLAALRGTVRLS